MAHTIYCYKKVTKALIFLLTLSAQLPMAASSWQPSAYQEDEFDLFDAAQDTALADLRAPGDSCEPADVLALICPPPINFANRLQQDLYKFTNGPFQTRALLDLPSFFLSEAIHNDDFHGSIWNFYNQTTEAIYHKKVLILMRISI